MLIFQASYPAYSAEVTQESRQSVIKKKDNIESAVSGSHEFVKSTQQVRVGIKPKPPYCIDIPTMSSIFLIFTFVYYFM